MSLPAEGQAGQPKGMLWEMGLSGSGLCHSWQEEPQPARLGMSWQWEQPANAGECAAVLWCPKNFL